MANELIKGYLFQGCHILESPGFLLLSWKVLESPSILFVSSGKSWKMFIEFSRDLPGQNVKLFFL